MRSTGLRSAPALIAVLALGAVTVLGFAAPFLPPDLAESLRSGLSAVSDQPWSPLAAILAYVALATLGVPQIVLITAMVVVFGGWAGFGLSLAGKLIACALGFWLGRRFGADLLKRHQGPRLARFMEQVGRNGFWVSAGVRLVPTVPSVVVNIAAGATPIRFGDFILGTAIGSVPKMALFAFGGQAAMSAVRDNDLVSWGALLVLILVWATLALLARHWMRRA